MPADPTPLETAVTDVLAEHVDEIRAKARDDHAEELDRAGFPTAAEYLRDHR